MGHGGSALARRGLAQRAQRALAQPEQPLLRREDGPRRAGLVLGRRRPSREPRHGRALRHARVASSRVHRRDTHTRRCQSCATQHPGLPHNFAQATPELAAPVQPHPRRYAAPPLPRSAGEGEEGHTPCKNGRLRPSPALRVRCARGFRDVSRGGEAVRRVAWVAVREVMWEAQHPKRGQPRRLPSGAADRPVSPRGRLHRRLRQRSTLVPSSTTRSGGSSKYAVAGRAFRVRRAKNDSASAPMSPAALATKLSRPR